MDTNQNLPTLAQIKRIPEFKPLKPKQIRFISALIGTDLRVEAAAKKCGVEWRSHYRWMHQDDYKLAVQYAKEILADTLESRMLDDAILGRVTPIVYKGEVTGNIREVNASERITLLKGLKPQYRENFSVNQFNGPVQLAVKFGNNVVDPLTKSVNDALAIEGNESK